jgi:Xaa-Pro aminopeptidase
MWPRLQAPGSSSASATTRPETILFLRDKDREREIWTGRRLGVASAAGALGVDEARPIEKLWSDLPALLQNYERIVYRTGIDEARDRRMLETVTKLRWAARGMVVPPVEMLDVAPLVHELRLKKSAAEIDVMRRAARVSRDAHVLAMKKARPGVSENEIDALIDYTFRRAGSTGAAYTNIVAGGANACILHYVENSRPLRDGDLVLIDAGAEWDYYASDVTRTFPVNGRFNAEQRAIYDVVLSAQLAAIDHVRPGVSFVSVHERALEALCTGLVHLKLLSGSVKEVLEKETYKRFYMHRTSHWLGLDVHDCGAYVQSGSSRILEPGMVLTVEPGLYVAEDDDTVEARWRGIGVRIEDDVLVTASGREVLTAEIPKSVSEIEATCQGRTLEAVR